MTNRILCLVPALAIVSGCVTVSHVTGPNGQDAMVIRCPSQESCLERAREECQGPYDLISSGTVVSGSTFNGNGSVSSRNEILVSCGGPRQSDLATVAPPSPQASPVSPPPASTSDGDTICRSASKFMNDFRKFWLAFDPESKPLPEMPPEKDFVDICRNMPERVQRCMHNRYREEHSKVCESVLKRLDKAEKDKIDSLFFE